MQYNGNPLQLRRFSAEDATTIATWPRSLTEARWWAGPKTSLPLPLEVVQDWHSEPDVHPYMLSDGVTPLGYGELWVDGDEQEVDLARLIVAPDHRGHGLGVWLVSFLVEEARRTDYPRVFLRVFPENQIAIACYARAGFTAVTSAEQEVFNQGQPVEYCWMSYSLSEE